MLGKFVLWVSGLIFFAYGVVCLFDPAIPAGYAGFQMAGGDAFVEVSAMYGGLQAGFGLWCLLGAINNDYARASLLSIVFVIGSLAIGRVIGLSQGLGDVTSYTYGAIFYESLTALLALLSLRAAKSNQA
jgi:hypothetical protein